MNEVTAAKRTGRHTSRPRKYDSAASRANIIAVATHEFATNGLSGARIDEIAAKTRTSKRMIYYYFGGKHSLYRHVLEAAYGRVRAGEEQLELDHMPPIEALRKLIEFTFIHHSQNPDFVRLIMIENIHHAQYLKGLQGIESLNVRAVEHLERIYGAGRTAGVFRDGLQPLAIHWLISALAFFNVSNRATFSMVFNWALSRPEGQDRLKDQVVETILRYVLEPDLIEKHCS